jgi:hypothetical protein
MAFEMQPGAHVLCDPSCPYWKKENDYIYECACDCGAKIVGCGQYALGDFNGAAREGCWQQESNCTRRR